MKKKLSLNRWGVGSTPNFERRSSKAFKLKAAGDQPSLVQVAKNLVVDIRDPSSKILETRARNLVASHFQLSLF